MTVEQDMFDVDISVIGRSSVIDAAFSTPNYIVQDDFSIDDVVVPEGAALDWKHISLASVSPSGRKQWHLAVFYNPRNVVGTTTYKLKVKDQTFNVSSTYATE